MGDVFVARAPRLCPAHRAGLSESAPPVQAHNERAIQVNVAIMRASVHLRELLSSNAELRRKLEALERKYDAQFRVVFDAIRELMEPPRAAKKGRIGFISA